MKCFICGPVPNDPRAALVGGPGLGTPALCNGHPFAFEVTLFKIHG